MERKIWRVAMKENLISRDLTRQTSLLVIESRFYR